MLFSDEQKEALKLAFALDQYPSVGTIEFLASELNLATRTITNWFHNHRMRIKQQSPHSDSQQQPAPTGPGFDPIQFRILLSHQLGYGGLPIPFGATGGGVGIGGGGGNHPYAQHGAAATTAADLSSFIPMLTTSTSSLSSSSAAAAAAAAAAAVTMDEQMSGLDLSVKHEPDTDFDDEDSRSEEELEEDEPEDDDEDDLDEPEDDEEESEERRGDQAPALPAVGSSRRKPAAPQWVNPDWLQSEHKQQPAAHPHSQQQQQQQQQSEVIINGVCVMQAADGRGADRRRSSETVRAPEPTSSDDGRDENKSGRSTPRSAAGSVKQESDGEREQEPIVSVKQEKSWNNEF